MSGEFEQPARKALGPVFARLAVFLTIAGFAVYIIWPEEYDGAAIEDIIVAVVATFPLMLIAILLIGWRLAVLAGDEVKVRDGMAVNAIAQLVALLVPSRLSEIAKPVGLNLIRKVPLSRGLAILAIERIFDAVFLACLALAAVAILTGPYRQSMQSSGLVLAGIAAIGVLFIGAILLQPALLSSLADRLPTRWARNQAKYVMQAVTRLADLRATMLAVGLSVVSWLAAYLIFLVFFHVLGTGELSPGQVLVIFVASTLGLIVSVAPGGLGTFEGAIALSLVAFGVPMGMAVAMALLLRLCLVIPVVTAASWFIVSGELSLARILGGLRDWRGRNDQGD